jgi:hypothetical protein
MDRFKHYTTDVSRTYQPLPLLRSTARCGDEWEVEDILDHRGSTMRDLEYKVQWVGYDPTWKNITDLKGTANEVLREYHTKHQLRVYKWMEAN